jgi:hypothetical protein
VNVNPHTQLRTPYPESSNVPGNAPQVQTFLEQHTSTLKQFQNKARKTAELIKQLQGGVTVHQ